MIAQLILIQAAIALALLPFVYYRVYRTYRVELLRHRLFVARDDLFTAWAASGRSFTHPGYMMTRYTLNGMLRWAHTVALPHLAFAAFSRSAATDRIVATHRQRKQKAFADLDDKGVALLERAQLEARLALASHLIYTSFPLFVIAMLIRLVRPSLQLSRVVERTESASPEAWPKIDAIAEIEGERRDFLPLAA